MKLVKNIALLGILIIGMSGSVQAATYTLDITFITNVPGVDYGELAPESQINSVMFDIGSPYTVPVDFTGTIIPGGWDTTTYLTGAAGIGQGVYNPDFVNPNPLVSSGRIFAITSDSAPTNLFFADFLGVYFQDADGDGVYDTAWGFFPDPNDPTVILEGTIPGQYFTVQVVPVPAAVWLLGSGVVGLVALKRRKRS